MNETIIDKFNLTIWILIFNNSKKYSKQEEKINEINQKSKKQRGMNIKWSQESR